MTQQRQVKGAPAGKGGEFKGNEHGEAVSGLTPEAPVTFGVIESTPTDQDYADARAFTRVELSNSSYTSGDQSWKKVMGEKTPRTAKNIATYDAHLDRVIDADPQWSADVEYRAKEYAKTRAYGRAYDAGVPIHPVAEAYFEDSWRENSHFGESAMSAKITEYERLREGLRNGTVMPSHIVGRGYKNPKRIAEEYLESSLAEAHRAMETRGRSLSVLSDNARGRVARYEREQAEGEQ